MSLRLLLIALVFPFVTYVSSARELTDLTLDIPVAPEKSAAEAKQEAFDQATLQATERLTEELLGSEKFARLWPNLQPKLLKNSTRYVLYIKGSAPQATAPAAGAVGPRVSVNLRVSMDNLETLLREEGVLNDGTVKVLPLFEINAGGGRYAWWSSSAEEDKGSLAQDLFKRFSGRLAARFKSKNVYVLDPTVASFRLGVPANYRTESLKREEQMLFAQYLKADVVISGRITAGRTVQDPTQPKLIYDLQMWQSKTGREVGEVQRTEALSSDQGKVIQATLEQTESKVLETLTGKLGETLASGSLNVNVVRLMVNGNMNYRQQAEFKRLLGQMRDIKVLRERFFAPSKIVFEAETPLTGVELAKAVQKSRFPLYTVAVDGAQDDSLALSVRALSSASAQ